VRSSAGTPYVALRPLLADFTLSMTRGAAVVYPKDAGQILAMADIGTGARVLEAGAGSGALSCWLLRAVGESGLLVSYERRADFAEIAQANVARFFGGPPPAWQLRVGDLGAEEAIDGAPFDRVVLDMLAPWECVGAAARVGRGPEVAGRMRRQERAGGSRSRGREAVARGERAADAGELQGRGGGVVARRRGLLRRYIGDDRVGNRAPARWLGANARWTCRPAGAARPFRPADHRADRCGTCRAPVPGGCLAGGGDLPGDRAGEGHCDGRAAL